MKRHAGDDDAPPEEERGLDEQRLQVVEQVLPPPLLDDIDALQRAQPYDYGTVVLPEFVPARSWR